MISDRIETLFTLLKCNNTDIAHWAGCTPGNISKLKRGHRIPRPASQSISTFAGGVYGYADYENLLTVVQELCGAADRSRENLIPALIAWLYDTKDIFIPDREVQPRSKKIKALLRKSFGEKLDQVMILLNLSNGQLASLLNVDNSLISRYRSGLHSPHSNQNLSQKLTDILFSRAERTGKTGELADLCEANKEIFNRDVLFDWLYRNMEIKEDSLAKMLLESLNDFNPEKIIPGFLPDLPAIERSARYWGTEGLRKAVVRFLSEAAAIGGELLLYSDEPMDWMTSDPPYFSLWASLMGKCVRVGVKIRVIHNVDRVGTEMVSAIKGWLSLYISGMIEPYVFSRIKNPRFCHTIFLHEGYSCIHGFYPTRSGQERWYDYITDGKTLKALKSEYDAMLSSAVPFLKVFPADVAADYFSFCVQNKGMTNYLLFAPPIATMPEKLFREILDRADLEDRKRLAIETLYNKIRTQFYDTLKTDSIHMVLMPPAKEFKQRINFSLDLLDIRLDYTQEEYQEHINAIADLINEEQNFHLTLLPDSEFPDIQLMTFMNSVVVVRNQEPYCAFAFLNPTLTKAVTEYLSVLIEVNRKDRSSTIEALNYPTNKKGLLN